MRSSMHSCNCSSISDWKCCPHSRNSRPRHLHRRRLRPARACHGRAFRPISRSSLASSVAIGTLCRPSASRRWRVEVAAGSACRPNNAGRPRSGFNAGGPFHRISAACFVIGGRNSNRCHPTNRARFVRTFADSNSCRLSSGRCCVNAGATLRLPSGSK